MAVTIDLRLYATLQKYMPSDAGQFTIEPGTRMADLIDRLGVPMEHAKLIFINGIRGDLDTPLMGGERVAIFLADRRGDELPAALPPVLKPLF